MTAARPGWAGVRLGEPSVAAAERPALGTSARVVVWPPRGLIPALAAADRQIAALDVQASRFRQDSEVSRLHRADGGTFRIGAGLAEAIAVALAAARWTCGLVDPTVGGAVIALGYDRDFAEMADDDPAAGGGIPLTGNGCPPAAAAQVPGWQAVRLDGPVLRLPAGVRLDLGATAKGLGADRAAAAAFAACGWTGGVLVSLGGDLATAGQPPAGGWPVLVADDHRQQPGQPQQAAGPAATQVVRLSGGALATSSVTARRWRRGGYEMHHIVDPRTGRPAGGPWRCVSVAAGDCATANAASTAAVILGRGAQQWLTARGLPARLAGHDGSVLHTGDWPAADGGRLTAPRLRLTDVGVLHAGPPGRVAR